MKKWLLMICVYIHFGGYSQLQVAPNNVTINWVEGVYNCDFIIPCVSITDAAGSVINWKWDKTIGGLGTPPVFYLSGNNYTPSNQVCLTEGWALNSSFGVGTHNDSIVIVDVNNSSNKTTLYVTIIVAAKDPSIPTKVKYPDKNLYKTNCYSNTSQGHPQLVYLDSAWCTCVNQYPSGSFNPPALGNSYTDPNFGAPVTILDTTGGIASGISCHDKYVLARDLKNVGTGCAIISASNGNVIQSPVVLDGGQGTVYDLVWDACDDETYYFADGVKAGIRKGTVGNTTSSSLVDYSVAPFNFNLGCYYKGSTKDNWIAWVNPSQKVVGIYDVNKNKTYWKKYSVDEGSQPLDITQVPITYLSKGWDKTTGKRYLIMEADPALIVYSVDTITGTLNFEFRGPGHLGKDTWEDCEGNQYLVGLGGGTCGGFQVDVSTWLINKMPQWNIMAEVGGARQRLFTIHYEGDSDQSAVVAASRNSPYFAVSTDYHTGAIGDTYGDNSNYGDVFLFEKTSSKYEVTRLAKHRLIPYLPWKQLLQTTISDDGSKIITTSNFGHPERHDIIGIETGVTPILTNTITLTTNSTPASCLNNDGTAFVIAVSNNHCGTKNYTYLWSSGATGTTAKNLSPATYTVTVTESLGCAVGTTSVIITGISTAGNLVLTTTQQDASCSASDGWANVTANATGALSYQWSNAITSATAINLAAGIYTLTVTQSGGCTAVGITTVTIGNKASFTCSINSTSALCATSNGSAYAYTTGGLGLTYSWSNNFTGITNTNLPAGNYTVTVTDNIGCTATSTTTIVKPPVIFAYANETKSAKCGSSTGAAIVNASGGTGSLSYLWSTGDTGVTGDSLASGNYLVTVTDANGCTVAAPFNINDVGLKLYVGGIKAAGLCYTDNKGEIYALISSATAPYKFVWSTGDSALSSNPQMNIDSLRTGTYSVTVTDADGCTASGSYIVSGATPIIASTNGTIANNATCGNNDGSMTIQGSGGDWGPWSYAWSDGLGTSSIVLGVAAGTYTVTMYDNVFCSGTAVLTVSNSNAPAVTISASNISCKSTNDGIINATINGGTGPYNFTWSNGTNTSSNSPSDSIKNLVAGDYFVTITDAGNCPAITSVTINSSSVVTATLTSTASTCGQNNGSASVTPGGGTGNNYSYLWSYMNVIAPTINNISAGYYTVTVTDNAGCSATGSVVVGNTNGIVATLNGHSDVGCNSTSDGSASVTVAGGSSPYTFIWSTNDTTITTNNSNQLTGLSSGKYYVTVSDAGGCKGITNVTIKKDSLNASIYGTDEMCGSQNGNAFITSTSSNLTYAWSTGNVNDSIINLQAGTYAVTVYSTNGCSVVKNITLLNSPGPNITIQNVINTCDLKADGAIDVQVNGVGLTYTWSNGGTSEDIANLIAGNYTVTVTTNNSCISTASVVVQKNNLPIISIQNVANTCQDKNNGSIDVQVTGAGITFLWSTGVTNQNISSLGSGNYSLTVTDINNCTAIATTTILFNPIPTIDAGTDQTITIGESVQLIASGGATYAWKNSIGLDDDSIYNPTANPIITTTYTVTGTDANGCKATDEVTVTVTDVIVPCNDVRSWLPMAFSPNNDGENDVLYVRGNCIEKLSLQVFDRWGEKVFETSDINKGWDGTRVGLQANTGAYFFKLNVKTRSDKEITKEGSIYLMR